MKKTLSLFSCIILFADNFAQLQPKFIDTVFVKRDLLIPQLTSAPTHTESGQVQLGLSVAVLAFGLILTICILYFLLKMGKGFGNVTFKTIGIILILTASLFLVVAGYSQDQITPVIGLLGTIAGFIFGSNLNPANSKKEGQD